MGSSLRCDDGRVLEQLRQRASDVVVVVEDLVVEPAAAGVPPHEDLVRGVDHDLPDVVVVESRSVSGPVPGEVPERALGDAVGVRDGVRPLAAAVLVEPVVDRPRRSARAGVLIRRGCRRRSRRWSPGPGPDARSARSGDVARLMRPHSVIAGGPASSVVAQLAGSDPVRAASSMRARAPLVRAGAGPARPKGRHSDAGIAATRSWTSSMPGPGGAGAPAAVVRRPALRRRRPARVMLAASVARAAGDRAASTSRRGAPGGGASRHRARRRSAPSASGRRGVRGVRPPATRSAVSSAARETAWRSSTSGEPVSFWPSRSGSMSITTVEKDRDRASSAASTERRRNVTQSAIRRRPSSTEYPRPATSKVSERTSSGSRRSDRCASTSSGRPGMTSPMWWYIARSPRRAPSTRATAVAVIAADGLTQRHRNGRWCRLPPDPTTATVRPPAIGAERARSRPGRGGGSGRPAPCGGRDARAASCSVEPVVEHRRAAERVPVPVHAAVGHHQRRCAERRRRARSGRGRCPVRGRRAAERTRGGRSRARPVPRRRSGT